MIEKLFGEHVETTSWAGGPAFDRLMGVIQTQTGIDDALIEYTKAVEVAAYRAGFADGVSIVQDVAAIQQQRAG